jgi:rod shape-determining protein MreD
MIFTPSILVRVSLLVLASLLIQVYLLSPVELVGTVIWILPACVVVFGLLGGGLTGAVIGFLLGILADGITDSPLGSTALALLLVGYLAGIYREQKVDIGPLLAGTASALGTIVANLAIGLVVLILGQAAPLDWGVASELIMQALYGFLFGIPIFLLFRRVLAPGLVDDRPSRRRRRLVAGGDVPWKGIGDG